MKHYHYIAKRQSLSLVFLVLCLFVIPLMIILIGPSRSTLASAIPVTPPVTPPHLNHPPVIYTNYLYGVRAYYSYTGFIRGGDPNAGDALTMEVYNLPPGLNIVACQNYPAGDKRYIVCRLEGRPTRRGRYHVLVKLLDNWGAFDQEVLLLKVR